MRMGLTTRYLMTGLLRRYEPGTLLIQPHMQARTARIWPAEKPKTGTPTSLNTIVTITSENLWGPTGITAFI